MRKKKVYIITEAGKNIGFGHLSRCCGIYDAFRLKNIEPLIIFNSDADINQILGLREHLRFNWLKNKKRLFALVDNSDIAVIDSYLAEIDLYQLIAEKTQVALYIDDNNRLSYPKGIVVNGNIYAKRLRYPKTNKIKYLLGPQFAILRKEFWDVPKKNIRKKVESIMITLGSGDVKSMAPKVLRLLSDNYPGLTKRVIVGEGLKEAKKKEIDKFKDNKTELIFYPDALRTKSIMLKTDIAISAGGQTLYELARIGVPTIGICSAENQRLNLEGWQEKMFIEYIGRHDDRNLLKKIVNSIDKLMSYKESVTHSKAGRDCLDGKGVERIADELIKRY